MTKKLNEKKSKTPSLYAMAAGALFGFAAVYIGEDLITGGADGETLSHASVSQVLAISVAAFLLACMIMVAIGYAIPKVGLAMKMFEDMEEWEDERTMMMLSCVGGGAYALALGLVALAKPFELIGSVPLLVALGVLAVVFTYASVRLLREYDELWKGVNSETAVIAFYLTLGIGGVWSTLAHLEFAPALAPLDWITLMTVATVAGAIIATQRRGMLED